MQMVYFNYTLPKKKYVSKEKLVNGIFNELNAAVKGRAIKAEWPPIEQCLVAQLANPVRNHILHGRARVKWEI